MPATGLQACATGSVQRLKRLKMIMRAPEAGSAGRFERKAWQRDEGGGGVMSIMHGQVFEKVGVNISTVDGTFSDAVPWPDPRYRGKPVLLGQRISLVAHMRNPYVPAVHMNTRYLNTGGEKGKRWFGGGADLTPIIAVDADSVISTRGLRPPVMPMIPNTMMPIKMV